MILEFDGGFKEKSIQIMARNKIPTSKINANGFSKRLKRFFQENEIIPIIRDFYPLLFKDDSLIGIQNNENPIMIDAMKGINLSLSHHIR